ncbi:Phage antirepressor protein KilAC domain protein [compost metagenome]
MNQLQVFNFSGHEVRVVVKDGQPWWVAKDVCSALGIDSSQTRRLDEDEKGLCSIQTLGGIQEMLCVNEPGLYELVGGSKKPEAKPFKRWINHDVLPSIRKHGAYLTPAKIEEVLLNPDTIIQLATQIKQEQETNRLLQSQIERDKPKVIFAEALETSNNSILIGELAKLLKQNGIEVGQNRLFVTLRQEGYLGKRGEQYNLPTQKAMELGLLEIKTRTINNPDGSVRTTKTTKVTGKGQIYFINRFKGQSKLA